MSDPFNSIRSLVPKRSRRTLVDERSFDYDIGQAIPVFEVLNPLEKQKRKNANIQCNGFQCG